MFQGTWLPLPENKKPVSFSQEDAESEKLSSVIHEWKHYKRGFTDHGEVQPFDFDKVSPNHRGKTAVLGH